MRKLMLLLCTFALLAVILIAATMPAMAWAPRVDDETILMTDYPPLKGAVDQSGFVRPNKDDLMICRWELPDEYRKPLYCNQSLAYRRTAVLTFKVKVVSVGKEMGGFAPGVSMVQMTTNIPLQGSYLLSYAAVMNSDGRRLFKPGSHLRITVQSWELFFERSGKLKQATNVKVHYQLVSIKPSS